MIYDIEHIVYDFNLFQIIPRFLALERCFLPISFCDGILVVLSNTNDAWNINHASLWFTGVSSIEYICYEKEKINSFISSMYDCGQNIDEILYSTSKDHSGSIRALSNTIIAIACHRYASDIHFIPQKNTEKIMLRIDGVLQMFIELQSHIAHKLKSRFKVMAKLNITETRRPQSGKMQVAYGHQSIDIRCSCHPTVFGESFVMRILRQGQGAPSLAELGFDNAQIKLLYDLALYKEGLVLFCGPTGCGKTTTMYSMLGIINTSDINIMTLEDPVEYYMPGVRQTDIGLITFSDGVRSVLRQDPDTILIGEIRDQETAHMAIRASMTGHQVISTIHVKSISDIEPRLMDFNIRDIMISGNLIGAVNQRLIRKLCNHCKIKEHNHYIARGCDMCYLGYKGRTVIAEIHNLKDNLQSDDLLAQAKRLLGEGITSLAEIKRILGMPYITN